MVSEYLKLCKTVVYSASKKPNLWPFSPGQRHFFFISGLMVTWTKFCRRYTFWCETNAGEHSTTFTGKWWIWKSKDLKYMCDDFCAKFEIGWPTKEEMRYKQMVFVCSLSSGLLGLNENQSSHHLVNFEPAFTIFWKICQQVNIELILSIDQLSIECY